MMKNSLALCGAFVAFLPCVVLAVNFEYGPSNLEEICVEGGCCARFAKVRAPLDYKDPAKGQHDLVYFVNSEFWDPVNKPNAPVFINMAYGSTGDSYTQYSVRHVDTSTFSRYFGVTAEFAEEMGALLINVPNRYFGCESARAGAREGTCPTSLDEIPEGEMGVLEAHDRLQYLSLTSVVDDIAHIANETITTFAKDWGMTLPEGAGRATNQPIVFGCSWPGAAAVYARMSYPEIFPGAVATSMPLVSSPSGNNHYRSFVGQVYELGAAGGSLECRNILTVGHQEIKRRIEADGMSSGPAGSCVKDCVISAAVNADFGLADDRYWSFGGGVPGLPSVQNINRDCAVLGCNIETTCAFLLDCFDEATNAYNFPFPLSAKDPFAAGEAYKCLSSFTEAARNLKTANKENVEGDDLMVFDADIFPPNFDLGPKVYDGNTLVYQMFGYKGPLWMTQTCNDDSGCPFVQGNTGGASYDQINARLWTSYAKPGETLAKFTTMMQEEAVAWHTEYGGQRPWKTTDVSNVYMVYNDADPWTAAGAMQHVPPGRKLAYDIGSGGLAHCSHQSGAEGESWIREWASSGVRASEN